jgi:hypothetical protein
VDWEDWVEAQVELTEAPELVHERTWATTWRLPTSAGVVWLKASAASHRFEAELVAMLSAGWPHLMPRVVAADTEQGWLLLEDAGKPFETLGNPPELWLKLLPAYADMQRHARVPSSVPDRTLPRWPELYDDLVRSDLPLDDGELRELRLFAPRFAELCADLASAGLPTTIQHDDLHHRNAYLDGSDLRIIDWGDASRSHPFVSLVVTFRFLEEFNGLQPDDPWLTRLRDAYLEPWGSNHKEAFGLAQRLGRFAHLFGWVAPRRSLPERDRSAYDVAFRVVLLRALATA